MSRSERMAIAVAALVLALPAAAADYGLGRAATAAEVAQWDIDVRADGQGLPPGRGSVADGQMLYDDKCASCHGVFGESNDYMAIAGGVGSLKTNAPTRTVGSKLNYATTLWDYIYRAMPFTAPKTLTADETYAITAYVLHLNDILPADAELDQQSLPQVVMPNRDGYTRDHGMGTVDGKPDVRNTACMKNCETQVEIASQLPANFTAQLYGDVAANFRHYAAARPAAEASAEARGVRLAREYACSACHGVDKAIVGPAFADIARKYGSDAHARLLEKVRAGGVGTWGSVPMPPQAHVPEADIKSIIEWVLAGAPSE